MPVSRVFPWWASQSFDEFNQFGYALSAQAYADVVAVKIALQPHRACLAGNERIECYRGAYDLAEEAIKLAHERYLVTSVDFRITDLFNSSPIELTLELSLSKKET